MRLEDAEEFKALCEASEMENVWRAGLLQAFIDINNNLRDIVKLIDDKSSFANNTLSSIDCRLQTIENCSVNANKHLDSIDSHAERI